jgi:hypothetical protein
VLYLKSFLLSLQIAPMNLSTEDLHELIRQQASYATLVTWLQQRQGCSYREACIQLNEELKQYRQLYASS